MLHVDSWPSACPLMGLEQRGDGGRSETWKAFSEAGGCGPDRGKKLEPDEDQRSNSGGGSRGVSPPLLVSVVKKWSLASTSSTRKGTILCLHLPASRMA